MIVKLAGALFKQSLTLAFVICVLFVCIFGLKTHEM
jgi:hypothetical protein